MNRSFLLFNNGNYRESAIVIAFENVKHLEAIFSSETDIRTGLRCYIAEDSGDIISVIDNFFPDRLLCRKVIESMNTVMPWPDYMPVITAKESLSLMISGKTLKDVLEDPKFERNMRKFER